MHVGEDDEDKHAAALRNASNLLDDLGEDTEVEVVAHSGGIGLCLSDSPQAETVQTLIVRGVVVAACENTLRGKGIEHERLAQGVVTVAAGIGELVGSSARVGRMCGPDLLGLSAPRTRQRTFAAILRGTRRYPWPTTSCAPTPVGPSADASAPPGRTRTMSRAAASRTRRGRDHLANERTYLAGCTPR